jgi:AraC-type DNA-binding domain-containing proteins
MDMFCFDKLLSKSKQFYIADLALRGGMSITGHNHDFYEFFVVLQGQFEENCNGKHMTLRARRMHILMPKDRHILHTATEEDTAILRNIAIRADVFEAAAQRLDITPEQVAGYYTLDEPHFAHFMKKTELVYGQYPNGKNFEFLMNHLLEAVFITAALEKSSDSDIPPWLVSACEEMEREENFYIGLPRLVELSKRSQPHLTRAFQRYYQMTPTDYINQIRLQNAAILLQTTEENVIDILFRCGYNGVSYFNRLFKAHYGLTPSKYREQKNLLFHQYSAGFSLED